MIRYLLLSVVCIALAGCAQVERSVLPSSMLIDARWAQAASQQRVQVDHGAWTRILGRYVKPDERGVNRFDYAAVSERDRQALGRYLDDLQATDVARLTKDQQLALWINLYNAATVNLILENYPVASIREITDGGLSFGPWDRDILQVSGQALSLNDIEHGIIRPIFDEPRIHYALNCAATGCPNLAPQAWRAKGLDAALERAERAYVNDPRGVSFTPSGGVVLSKIYIWFQEDFGLNEAEVIARLRSKAGPELRQALEGKTRVARYQYDWSLNAPKR